MAPDDIDQILSKQEEVIPSSGFVVSVMDTVRREAAALPPIPFPWKRALPGLMAAGLAVFLLLGAIVEMFAGQTAAQPLRLAVPAFLVPVLSTARAFDAGWVALALILSLVALNISMRLAQRRL